MVPGVRFSKDPKTSRAQKRTRKAPEKTTWCFSRRTKISGPRKYVIFSRKLYGYSLAPEKRFREQARKTKREEEVRENDVIMKYGIYQVEIQWLIAVNRQISKHHRARRERKMNLVLVKVHEMKSISLP